MVCTVIGHSVFNFNVTIMFSSLDQWRNISEVSVHLLTTISNPSLGTNFSTRSAEDPLELLYLLLMCASCGRGGYGCKGQRLMGNASAVTHSTANSPTDRRSNAALSSFLTKILLSLATNTTTGQLPGHDYHTQSIIR